MELYSVLAVLSTTALYCAEKSVEFDSTLAVVTVAVTMTWIGTVSKVTVTVTVT